MSRHRFIRIYLKSCWRKANKDDVDGDESLHSPPVAGVTVESRAKRKSCPNGMYQLGRATGTGTVIASRKSNGKQKVRKCHSAPPQQQCNAIIRSQCKNKRNELFKDDRQQNVIYKMIIMRNGMTNASMQCAMSLLHKPFGPMDLS